MVFYPVNLAILLALNAASFYWSRQKRSICLSPKASGDLLERIEKIPSQDHALTTKTFRNNFLIVYALAVAADWLQGSFIYTVYKVTHNLSERTVAALFTTGFLCGAVSATFVGGLADKYGRRKACLAYCLIYSLSCLTVFATDIKTLVVGRALGGVSTTLLFSVFEAWMVTGMRATVFEDVENSLSGIFGSMATLNGIIAIISGVVSEVLVWYTGSNKAPFAASIICLFAASQYILKLWNENYGEAGEKGENQTRQPSSSTWSILQNTRITTLGLASCFFEGSMYVLVYFWSQAIMSARKAAQTPGTPPFGIIFASFMCALMMGSWLFKHISQTSSNSNSGNNVISESSYAIQIVLCVSASSLAAVVLSERESIRFWAFCVFEFCIGLYLPSMGSLKGSLIGDAQRGKIYGLMRLPLNSFVVLLLSTIGEDQSCRENRFMLCGALMLVAAWLMRRNIT